MTVQDERLAGAAAKENSQELQSLKISSLEQEIISLKEKLFIAEEKNEALDHEVQLLRQIKTDLQNILIDDVDEIRFTDHLALEAYEKEERVIFNEFKRKLYELKSRYKADSTELCKSCIGELIEI